MQFFPRENVQDSFFAMMKLQDMFSSNGAWFLSLARFFFNIVFLSKIFSLVTVLLEFF